MQIPYKLIIDSNNMELIINWVAGHLTADL